MERQIKNSGNISTGEHHKLTLSLEDKDFNQVIEIPALGFSQVSVAITTINATGTSGNAVVSQQICRKAAVSALGAALVLTAGSTQSLFDQSFTGSEILIDLSAVTLGVVGKIEIDVILKRV